MQTTIYSNNFVLYSKEYILVEDPGVNISVFLGFFFVFFPQWGGF